jgi:hypothetical protein
MAKIAAESQAEKELTLLKGRLDEMQTAGTATTMPALLPRSARRRVELPRCAAGCAPIEAQAGLTLDDEGSAAGEDVGAEAG